MSMPEGSVSRLSFRRTVLGRKCLDMPGRMKRKSLPNLLQLGAHPGYSKAIRNYQKEWKISLQVRSNKEHDDVSRT